MTNADIAKAFARIAVMLEMDGANPFRIRAYREASRVIGEHPEPMAKLAKQEGGLDGIRGIGKDLAQKIRDLVETGTTETLAELHRKYPEELVALTKLQGVGPKRVKQLFDQLGIRSREDLERAAREQKLRDLPGFGETMEQKVLKALASTSEYKGRVQLAGAWGLADALVERIRALSGVEIVEPAGSFRRRKDMIGDLDILVAGGDPETVMAAFTGGADVAEVLGKGDTKSSVKMKSGLQVDLRLVPVESFGAALLYFTGSKAHNIELRKIAIDKGLMLNEYGLMKGKKVVAARTEQDVYEALGMAWIPPELREARGEIAQAIKGTLPKLIELDDIVADLHMHTNRTDGRESLETMVRAARDRGYAYCAITDHSKALAMARGFDEARVRQSVDEIAAVRKQVPGIEVLHGLEVDILADGSLDLGDDGLALLDFVIVSLHSRLDQPAPQMTERVLRAISHPAVHLFGHPTGRLLGARQAAAFDMEKVMTRAAEVGIAMEINAQPNRLDLNDGHARLAHELGIPIMVNTDAHSIPQMDYMRFGLFAARRAGLTKKDVLNTLPFEKFEASLRKAKGSSTGAKRPATAETRPAPGARTPASKKKAATAKKAATKKPDAKPKSTKRSSAKKSGSAETKASRARRTSKAKGRR